MNFKHKNIDRRLRDIQLRSKTVNRAESPEKKIIQLSSLIAEIIDLMLAMRALQIDGEKGLKK